MDVLLATHQSECEEAVYVSGPVCWRVICLLSILIVAGSFGCCKLLWGESHGMGDEAKMLRGKVILYDVQHRRTNDRVLAYLHVAVASAQPTN